ncbi:MAG: hypothetical protein QM688_05780 [Sphingomonas bacterium]
MRSFADRSFFRTFDLLEASAQSPGGRKRAAWTIGDTEWRRERHSFTGSNHSFATETVRVRHVAAPRWTLLVVREFWWIEAQDKPLRDLRWAKLVKGSGPDALGWFRAQDRR